MGLQTAPPGCGRWRRLRERACELLKQAVIGSSEPFNGSEYTPGLGRSRVRCCSSPPPSVAAGSSAPTVWGHVPSVGKSSRMALFWSHFCKLLFILKGFSALFVKKIATTSALSKSAKYKNRASAAPPHCKTRNRGPAEVGRSKGSGPGSAPVSAQDRSAGRRPFLSESWCLGAAPRGSPLNLNHIPGSFWGMGDRACPPTSPRA